MSEDSFDYMGYLIATVKRKYSGQLICCIVAAPKRNIFHVNRMCPIASREHCQYVKVAHCGDIIAKRTLCWFCQKNRDKVLELFESQFDLWFEYIAQRYPGSHVQRSDKFFPYKCIVCVSSADKQSCSNLVKHFGLNSVIAVVSEEKVECVKCGEITSLQCATDWLFNQLSVILPKQAITGFKILDESLVMCILVNESSVTLLKSVIDSIISNMKLCADLQCAQTKSELLKSVNLLILGNEVLIAQKYQKVPMVDANGCILSCDKGFSSFDIKDMTAGGSFGAFIKSGVNDKLYVMSTSHSSSQVLNSQLQNEFGIQSRLDERNKYGEYLTNSIHHAMFRVKYAKDLLYHFNDDPCIVYARRNNFAACDVSLFSIEDNSCVEDKVLLPLQCVQNFSRFGFSAMPNWCDVIQTVTSKQRDGDDKHIEIHSEGFFSFPLGRFQHEILYYGYCLDNTLQVTSKHIGLALYTNDGHLHSFIKGGTSVMIKGVKRYMVLMTPAGFALEQAKELTNDESLHYVTLNEK